MDKTLWVIAGALACWRMTSLLYREELADGFRKLFGIIHDEHGPAAYPNQWAMVFECFWCLSLVVALPVCVFVVWAGGFRWYFGLLLWPTLSAATIWLETRTGHFQVHR